METLVKFAGFVYEKASFRSKSFPKDLVKPTTGICKAIY